MNKKLEILESFIETEVKGTIKIDYLFFELWTKYRKDLIEKNNSNKNDLITFHRILKKLIEDNFEKDTYLIEYSKDLLNELNILV